MNLLEEANYQFWAENIFFKLLGKVTEDQWVTKLPDFTKSLKEIYIHKYEVMYSWFTMIIVKSSKKIGENPLNIADFEPLSKNDFITESLKLFAKLIDYLKNNKSKNVTLEVEWLKNPYSVDTDEIIYNILNHLTYHRGQTAFLFKKFGLNIPETDYNPYLYEVKKLS